MVITEASLTILLRGTNWMECLWVGIYTFLSFGTELNNKYLTLCVYLLH